MLDIGLQFFGGRGSSSRRSGGGTGSEVATLSSSALVAMSFDRLKKTYKTANATDKKNIRSEMAMRGYHYDDSSGSFRKNRRQGFIS